MQQSRPAAVSANNLIPASAYRMVVPDIVDESWQCAVKYTERYKCSVGGSRQQRAKENIISHLPHGDVRVERLGDT